MKLSRYIKCLQDLQEEHGDVSIVIRGSMYTSEGWDGNDLKDYED